jgi:hypothetical protein
MTGEISEGLYLAATAPKNVGVRDGDADACQVFVHGRLVGEQDAFVQAVGDAHDVDVGELGAALAPIGVRHDVEPADLPARLNLAPSGTRQWNSAL